MMHKLKYVASFSTMLAIKNGINEHNTLTILQKLPKKYIAETNGDVYKGIHVYR